MQDEREERERGETHPFMWLQPGSGLEESYAFEQTLYRELRDSYPAATSPVELLDWVMRDAYLVIRPGSRKVTHSGCVASYLTRRLHWSVSDVPVSGRLSIRSVRFGPFWVPIRNTHVPFQFSVQRLVSRWFFEIGGRLGLSSAIFTQAERLRERNAPRHADRLPPWTALQRVVRGVDRPLEGMESLYRAGALHLIEGRISCTADATHYTEGDTGPSPC